MDTPQAATEELPPITAKKLSMEEPVPKEATDTETEAGSPPAAPAATGWGANALEMMKDRAASAKNSLTPQLQNMREMTSKKLEKYQSSIDKVKSSASAAAVIGRERMQPALNRVKEGSTQGWSILKTKLASAAPVAEKIQTMGIHVVTDLLGDSNIEVLFVDNPARANARFLESYKVVPIETSMFSRLRLARTMSSNSMSSVVSTRDSSGSTNGSNPAEQCFANPYILGTVLLFCGDVQDLGRVMLVNSTCRTFISSEVRLWRFCVRYGEMPAAIRFRFWEHVASVRTLRESSELDFDTYLQMALSKGEWTELILTDVRRTYGRVAPHKRSFKDRLEPVEDTEEELINQLSSILHALSGRFPDVGYCQGMDYIAAHMLDHVKKSNEAQEMARMMAKASKTTPNGEQESEDGVPPRSPERSSKAAATQEEVEMAFWMLVSLFENYGLRHMFSPGLHRLHLHCYQYQRLFELGLPELAAHFDLEKVVVEMFIVGWFQTLFLYLNALPRETLDRIWDIFLMENNWKIMQRVALAVLQVSEPSIANKPIDEVMQFLNTFGGQSKQLLSPEALLPKALSIKITNSMLTKLQKQHSKRKKSSPERRN